MLGNIRVCHHASTFQCRLQPALIHFCSIVGPDYISLIGGEVRNPRRILPRAFKSTIYRVFFFYVIGAFCVGIVASSNDEALLGAIADGAPGAAKSPYVICESRQMLYSPASLTDISNESTPNSHSPFYRQRRRLDFDFLHNQLFCVCGIKIFVWSGAERTGT